MRSGFLVSTLAFWCAITAIAVGAATAPGGAPADSNDRVITLEQLTRHARPGDCWMAIRGRVYDLTKYLPDHPSRPEIIEPWCGKEATQAYETKTKGRKHSESADNMLPAYRIGTFSKASQ
jgi:cytochrome b involved in lipid metabolism